MLQKLKVSSVKVPSYYLYLARKTEEGTPGVWKVRMLNIHVYHVKVLSHLKL